MRITSDPITVCFRGISVLIIVGAARAAPGVQFPLAERVKRGSRDELSQFVCAGQLRSQVRRRQ